MKKHLLKSSALVMTAIIFLRILGFIREASLAAVYGAGIISDAFIISFTLPNTFLAMIASSASSVYIPVYQNAKGDKNRFTSNIINLLAIIGIVFSLIFVFAPQALVFLFASQSNPETFALATDMTRIIVFSAVPILLLGIFSSFLNIHSVFFRAQIANALLNICVITSIFISSKLEALPLMAVGVLVGNTLCLLILVILSAKYGYRHSTYINVHDENLKEMLWLLVPVFLSSAIVEINQIIDRNFASSLAVGTISSLNYAAKINGLIGALMGGSLATVLFPKMSETAANGDISSIKKYLSGCIKSLLPLLMPIMLGIIILSEPIVRILFERGSFTSEDTMRTAECLQMYAICFVFNNLNPLLTRAFYAMQKTKAPAISSAIAVVSNVILNLILIGPLQHRGLALATSAANILSTILMIYHMRRNLGSLHLFSNRKEFGKLIFAVALMGIFTLCGRQILPFMSVTIFQCAVMAVALVAASAVIYLIMLIILRTEFVQEIIKQFHR